MTEQPKVLYDSPEAAHRATVTGWVSRLGHFYGDNEHLARYDGCTHRLCKCGAEVERAYTICQACRDRQRTQSYWKLPFREWDGSIPLTLWDDDRFFFGEDDLLDWCENHDVEPSDLPLVICEPSFAREIDGDDRYCDDLPEDRSLKDVYPELAVAIEVVNELIRKREKPLSWSAGRYRTTYGKSGDED